MNNSLHRLQFLGFLFTSILGVFLHFLYSLTGNNPLVALISAVNESTWEHMKLLYFPMFFYAMFESQFFLDKYEAFWCIKAIGILLGLSIIPTIYYTYTGALGFSSDFFNILIFFIAAAATYCVETCLFAKTSFKCNAELFAAALLCILGLLFIIWTYYPPDYHLFQEPSPTLPFRIPYNMEY